MLAQASISVSELADVEPQVLERLSSGKPGAICILYGQTYAFAIQIDCAGFPPVVALGKSLLDDWTPPEPITSGDAESFETWRGIVDAILKAEGFVGATLQGSIGGTSSTVLAKAREADSGHFSFWEV